MSKELRQVIAWTTGLVIWIIASKFEHVMAVLAVAGLIGVIIGVLLLLPDKDRNLK